MLNTLIQPTANTSVQTIMFDMDGTLLDLAFDNYFWRHVVLKQWAKLNGYSLEETLRIVEPLLKSHEGTLNWYSLPFWNQTLKLDVRQLKHDHREKISLRPKALDLLAALTAKKIPLWLVTNADPQALEIKLEQTGIGHFFDKIISSTHLGFAKEQAEFWNALQAEHPFNPAHTLFVDDNPQVLLAAKQYGIAHLLDVHHPDSSASAKIASEHHMLTDLMHILDYLNQVNQLAGR